MNDNEKIDYKTLYHQVWNQYNIYYQSYSVYNNKFNTIGAVSSIFVLVLTIAGERWSKWFYLPLPLLLFPFFVALINLMYKEIEIPWFGKEKLESQLSEGVAEFFKLQIDDIFHATNTLYDYKVFARRWVSISVWSIIASFIVSFISLFLSMLPLVCRT